MKILFLSLLLVIAPMVNANKGQKIQYGKYNIDSDHTRVSFLINHFMVSQVEGKFNTVKGYFSLNEQLSNNKTEITIPVTSLDTGVAKRDDHLKSADFFEVNKYPEISFKSKTFTGTLEKFKIVGDLTIKDVTKEITLEGSYTGSVKDPWGQTRAAVKATGKIKRKDFNIKYNDMIEIGPVVGDEVTINILSEGILEKK